IRTSARTTTNARPAPAGRSPTTSANSAPSASRSPSAASPNPDQADQAAPRPPDHPPITGGPRAGSAGAAARPAKVPFSGQRQGKAKSKKGNRYLAGLLGET